MVMAVVMAVAMAMAVTMVMVLMAGAGAARPTVVATASRSMATVLPTTPLLPLRQHPQKRNRAKFRLSRYAERACLVEPAAP